jgi:hypothetical protein
MPHQLVFYIEVYIPYEPVFSAGDGNGDETAEAQRQLLA